MTREESKLREIGGRESSAAQLGIGFQLIFPNTDKCHNGRMGWVTHFARNIKKRSHGNRIRVPSHALTRFAKASAKR